MMNNGLLVVSDFQGVIWFLFNDTLTDRMLAWSSVLISGKTEVMLRGSFQKIPMPFSNLKQPVYLIFHLFKRIKPLAKGASICSYSSPVTDEVKVAKQSVLNRYGVEAVCVLFRVDKIFLMIT